MRNVFGKNLTVTLFGESHGKGIGAVIDGVSPGVKIDEDYISRRLDLRRGEVDISTPRREKDEFEILSGVVNGVATGSPIMLLIKNADTKSGDYAQMSSIARPSHADFSAFVKYSGFNDTRGGGHFSGRITAGLVMAGAIVQKALEEKGIFIGTHLKSVGEVCDRGFEDFKTDITALNSVVFPVLDEKAGEKMRGEILSAKNDGDSIGGVLETAVIGLEAGYGEPWFDSVEGLISHAVFSIGGVKGIEFGGGFNLSKMRGSDANDALFTENGEVKTRTNNSGGICGGITNGMPIVFRCAIKPTPTIFKEQETVDFKEKTSAVIKPTGRHDPCIAPRIRAVIDAVTALVIADLIITREGENALCTD